MANKSFSHIKSLIYPNDPFIGFSLKDKKIKLNEPDQSFINIDGKIFLKNLVCRLNPSLVIEVGSWMGASAIEIGTALKSLNKKGGLICVDTWLGAREFWTTAEDSGGWYSSMQLSIETYRNGRYKNLAIKNGYPNVYYDFLANIALSGLSDVVCPFPQTSVIAARWFKAHGISADLIYIDASHDYEDVKMDINLYWNLLNNGGILFGDDYWIVDVKNAVDEFCVANKLQMKKEMPFWLIMK